MWWAVSWPRARAATRFSTQAKLDALRQRQVDAVQYLDRVIEELFDLVPRNTYITITSDHGELFGEDGYFGHGPIQHEKVFEVPLWKARSMIYPIAYVGPGAGFAFLGSFLTIVDRFPVERLLDPDLAVPRCLASGRLRRCFRRGKALKSVSSFSWVSTASTRASPNDSWPKASCRTLRGSRSRALSAGCARLSPRCPRSRGPPSPPASILPGTTSSTS